MCVNTASRVNSASRCALLTCTLRFPDSVKESHMKTAEYLDALKKYRQLPSDYALANLIGVSRQSISQWRSGVSLPDPLFAAKIGECLDIDPLLVIADVESEKYVKRHHPHNAEAWRALIQRLGGVAASVLLGTLLLSPHAPAHSQNDTGLNNNIHCQNYVDGMQPLQGNCPINLKKLGQPAYKHYPKLNTA